MQLTAVQLELSNTGLAAHLVLPGGRLTDVVARELASAAGNLVEDRAIRVVTLRSAEAPFCDGPDDDLVAHELRPDPASALATLRVPVITGVAGACRGEGLELALATDIIVGTPGSVYALDHIRRGRLPVWGGSQRFARSIGGGPATAHGLLGSDLDSSLAHGLGLVHHLTDDLDQTITDLVDTLCARGPLALEFTKEAVHRGSELPLRDGLRLEGDLNHQLAATEDRAEGLAAFFAKRPPDFGGR